MIPCIITLTLLCLFSTGDPAPTLRALPERPITAAQSQLLEELLASSGYFIVAMKLSQSPSTGLVGRLQALTRDDATQTRERAAWVLALIPTRTSLTSAVAVALNDPGASARRTVSSALVNSGTPLLIKELDLLDGCKKGLEDDDADVRFSFALLLAKADEPAGTAVLKKALKHRDHHRRETAAEALADLGNDAGASVLVKMLRYTDKNHPLLRANRKLRKDVAAWANLLAIVNDERVRICGHAGSLGLQEAVPALKKMTRSKTPTVAEAARDALEKIAAARDPKPDDRPNAAGGSGLL